ncbi:MAG: AMP-binding protein [Actinomycetota bacterium]|nr:AMP-binding protein [Actinomycetota bacterium]
MGRTETAAEVMPAARSFRAARDFLLAHRDDHAAACRGFRWPELHRFNWARDWFDVLAVEQPGADALWVVADGGEEQRLTFAELSARSQHVAGWLADVGVRRGDRVLLLLGNCPPLWELLLACTRLGAVVVPTCPRLSPHELEDRVRRTAPRCVVAHSAGGESPAGLPPGGLRVVVGDPAPGWVAYPAAGELHGAPVSAVDTGPDEPLLLYFTSGTTSRPKLVEHTHTSYPVGHLSTMYWVGLQPGDVHLNVSAPGWAKHAWSSVFAPWNAGATVLVHDGDRSEPRALLDVLVRCQVTTFCAPPDVWRRLVQQDLSAYDVVLRECVSAGAPLEPEIVQRVQDAWGLPVRDGFGQTETTAQIGNPPGQPVRPGSMGRPLPGYVVALVDPVTGDVGHDGEICLELARRPVGLTSGYRDDPGRFAAAVRGGFYHTGDLATMDADGYLTHVGRADDVRRPGG